MDFVRKEIVEWSHADANTNNRHIPHPIAKASDRVIDARNGDEYTYKFLKKKVAPIVSALRSKFLTILRSRKNVRPLIDLEDGDLDVDALYRLCNGDKRLFSEMVRAPELNTAVMILRDFSGSMCGKFEWEQAACLSLTEALSQFVPVEVISFQNFSTANYSGRDCDLREGPYNRFEPFIFTVFKHFDEDFKKIRTRFTEGRSDGNNIDCEAIDFVVNRLRARPEKRKILIVLSDGQPAGWVNEDCALEKATIEAVQRAVKYGMEVIGVGMLYTSIDRYYPDNIKVDRMEELPSKLFKLLKNKMV